MKNVTGYDLSKLLAGSWGTLAVLDEVSVKVLPAPDQTRTLLLLDLADDAAVKVMCAALGSSHDVSGAAHVGDRTALRIEGVAPSVEARLKGLRELLSASGANGRARHPRKPRLRREVLTCAAQVGGRCGGVEDLPPADRGSERRQPHQGKTSRRRAFHWSGGLIPPPAPSADADHERARCPRPTGGHATLMRAPHHAAVPVFQPQPLPLAALASRVKESFDPKRLFNPGRMG